MMRFFYLAIVGLMFFKSSCSGLNKNIYSGNIHTDTYAHYINDSIQFSVELAGDHFLNKEKKDLKRKLKTYGIKPFKKKVIEYFETIIDPYFDVFLLHFKDKEELNKFLNHNSFQYTEGTNHSGQIAIKDKTHFVIGSATSKADGSFVLLLSYAKDKTLEDYELMSKEYIRVHKTLKYGEH